jgi:hypothetical protein
LRQQMLNTNPHKTLRIVFMDGPTHQRALLDAGRSATSNSISSPPEKKSFLVFTLVSTMIR